ncbi:DUF2252 domain-containing protein [Flavitalea antarctica]
MWEEPPGDFQSESQTITERLAAGKAIRQSVPRERLGDFKVLPDRADPIAILEEQNKSRLQDLVPIRHTRMLSSSFAFLRGAARIMTSDLAATNTTTGITVQACGDMHVANFGVFASAERNLVFGINDFDETFPGPWEWDLQRLVTSIVVGGKFLGADKALCAASVKAAVSTYRKRLRQYADMGNLELWYSTINEKDIMKTITPAQQKGMKKITSKARSRTHVQVLGKLTDIIENSHRLKDDPPLVVHETHSKAGVPIEIALASLLRSYLGSLNDDRKKLLSHYKIVDVARKVVGVGSVGTRCWVIYLRGAHSRDPLFLQVKEAQQSVLERFLPGSVYVNCGERIVQGQRLIQGAPDIFLGWGELDGIHFYVRQLRDMKGGVEFDPQTTKLENMQAYCSLCAWALALAHAKSGDAAMIAGYTGNSDVLDQAMVRFAFAYADQNDQDYRALIAAAKSGRIQVARA